VTVPRPPLGRVAGRGLSKSYGRRFALRDVDFHVDAGRALALVGHNGAGKSTLFQLIAGRTKPTAGTLDFGGATPGSIGYVGHASFLYGALTARENLELVAKLHRRDPAATSAVLDRVGLGRFGDRLARELSRGMTQRLSIARLLTQDAQLWLLDEPASGLDESGRRWLETEMKAARDRGCSLVVSSHHRDLLLATATDILVLSRGRRLAFSPITGAADIDRAFELSDGSPAATVAP
jgi:heme exporter protein A